MQSTKRKSAALIALIAVIALLIACTYAPSAAKAEGYGDAAAYNYADNYNFTLTADSGGYRAAIKPAVRTTLKTAVIPEKYNGLPVTEIANNGFMACAKLERVVLPASVKAIGMNAFASCAKLEHVTMPNVTNVGNNAFGMCASLDRLFLPYTVETVGATILRSNANTVYVQKSRAEVSAQWSSAWNDYHTGEIVYGAEPADVLQYREILDEANSVIGYEIAENQGLAAMEQDVVLYTSFRADGASEYLPVLNICSEAFTMSYAKSITIKDRRKDDPAAPEFNHKINVRSNAFLAAFVEEVVFDAQAAFDHPAGLQVGPTESVFDGSPIVGDENGRSTRVFEFSTVKSVTLPSGIDAISDRMFCYCDALGEIKIAGAAYENKNVLPQVTKIGGSAFDSCSALKNLYIPSSVSEMGNAVFNDCGLLERQVFYVDFYEDELPAGWSAHWSDGIQANASVSYKALTDVIIDLQDGKGGTLTVGVKAGGAMPAVVIPQRAGYAFQGIFSQPNGQGLQYYTSGLESARTWDGATTLYAYWVQTGCAVTLDSGAGAQTVNAFYGQPMPAANKPARNGYSFEGFYALEEDGARTYYYNANMGGARNWDRTAPTTLLADWKTVEYRITYANLKDGSNSASNPKTYTVEDADVVFLNPGDRKGYTGTWDIPVIENGSWGDRTITAVWTPIVYSIAYENLRGGINPDTNPDEYTIESEDIVFAPPTGREGYEGSWNIPGIDKGSTGHVPVIAVWTPIAYKITYENLQGGINPNADITEYTIESPMIEFAAPYGRDGYAGEWDTVRIPSGSIGDRVITAIWTPIVYKITYVIDDLYHNPNAKITEYTIESDEIVFEIPTGRRGYLGYWNPSSIPKGSFGDKEIKAEWILEVYTITYVLREGMSNPAGNPTQYTVLSEDITFLAPVQNGYICWWNITGIPAGSIGNVSVIADKAIIDHPITYILNGGTNDPNNPKSIKITETKYLFPAKQQGYLFAGWQKDGQFVSVLSEIDRPITLIANWDRIEHFPGVYSTDLTVNEEVSTVWLPTANFNTSFQLTVGASVKELHLYSQNANVRYKMFIIVANRSSEINMHLYEGVKIQAPIGEIAVKMTSQFALNLYSDGKPCEIYGGNGYEGNAPMSNFAFLPAGGKSGMSAIACYHLAIHASNLYISGGNGDRGDTGFNAIGSFGDGGRGGNGGNGGAAVSAESVVVIGNNVSLYGGNGGRGGNGGTGRGPIGTVSGGAGGAGGSGGAAVTGELLEVGKNLKTASGSQGTRGADGAVQIIIT